MTADEAKVICDIMMTADGRCLNCASGLLEKFLEKFPQFKAQVDEAWGGEFI